MYIKMYNDFYRGFNKYCEESRSAKVTYKRQVCLRLNKSVVIIDKMTSAIENIFREFTASF